MKNLTELEKAYLISCDFSIKGFYENLWNAFYCANINQLKKIIDSILFTKMVFFEYEQLNARTLTNINEYKKTYNIEDDKIFNILHNAYIMRCIIQADSDNLILFQLLYNDLFIAAKNFYNNGINL